MGDKTLFEIFRTPASPFSVSQLKNAYYGLIRRVHPDSQMTDLPKKEKEVLSSFISTAYQKLKNDYSRSIYEYSLAHGTNLVKRDFHNVGDVFGLSKDLTVLDSIKDRLGCDKKLVSLEFLDRILYMEDRIANCSLEELPQIQQEIEAAIKQCQENKTSLQSLVHWRYYQKLQESIAARTLLE
ncbi:hypothetical protein NEHOM01_0736 [Nematocida homosporus]|uniref:uncharacterized protein n=1 Tax=Nematocida homosporus TaxID=1912981 RepID=UPI002220ED35|nr:uncharacterized protein NEHOM01_0736 [Nematocida homosporus]KAI5185278.1 hypothetical protein NEHOM01_0736 [Nematocida homosporus]